NSGRFESRRLGPGRLQESLIADLVQHVRAGLAEQLAQRELELLLGAHPQTLLLALVHLNRLRDDRLLLGNVQRVVAASVKVGAAHAQFGALFLNEVGVVEALGGRGVVGGEDSE
ncbi:hypothetical protein PFISCL1PPCAC_4175, partial [Pristionchus fissidentatus]